MVGAASPLWLMFGGAAAAGATWWWWASRWRQAVNLEAISALAPEPLALELLAPEPLSPAAEAWVEPVADLVAEPDGDRVADVLNPPIEIAAEAATETLDVAESEAESMAEPQVECLEAVEPAPVEATVFTVAPEPVAALETVATPEPAQDVQVEAAEPGVDDLTRLVGIGPKLAASLGELGVTRFSQIAAWTAEDLQSIDQLLGLKGRADRDAWVAQAKRFVAPQA
jgi:predicted flap endonuclease-1-like 5' DNA nuclease